MSFSKQQTDGHIFRAHAARWRACRPHWVVEWLKSCFDCSASDSSKLCKIIQKNELKLLAGLLLLLLIYIAMLLFYYMTLFLAHTMTRKWLNSYLFNYNTPFSSLYVRSPYCRLYSALCDYERSRDIVSIH